MLAVNNQLSLLHFMLVVTGVAFLSKWFNDCCFCLDTAQSWHQVNSTRFSLGCNFDMSGAATLQTTQKLAKDRGFNVGPESDSPLIQAGSMGKKWRSERNFWIAFICFTLWW